MNTSMTINATAMWLLALYQVVAEEQARPGADPAEVACTRRHHPERHHQGVPVPRDVRLPARAVAAADHRHGRLHGRRAAQVEPDQHLQLPPAGGRARPRCRRSPTRCARRSPCSTRSATPARCPPSGSARWSPRISFFVNAGVRFVEEMCKMRAFVAAVGRADPASATAWPTRSSAGSATASRSTRSGSPRPSPRTTSSASSWRCWPSRCRRTPAPGPCSCRPGTRRSGCPGPGTSSGRCACSRCSPSSPTCSSTTTSSRARTVVEAKVAELVEGAKAEIDRVQAMGGAVPAVESGYMKSALVSSHVAAASARSRPARTWWSGSTGSRPPSPTR